MNNLINLSFEKAVLMELAMDSYTPVVGGVM